MNSPRMNFLFLLGCFFLSICNYVQAISYDKCGSGEQILNLRKLQITPDPIHLSERTVRVSIDANLTEDIPAGSVIHFKAWKVTKVISWDIYIAAPCFFPIGCDVEHCKFFEYFSGESVCPVKAQDFIAENVQVDIPNLGNFIKWFASGRFLFELKITGPKGEQLSCYSIKGEAKALFGPMKTDIKSIFVKHEEIENKIFL